MMVAVIAVIVHRVIRGAAALAVLVVVAGYVVFMWSEVAAWWAAVWTVVAVVLALRGWLWVEERVGWKR